MTAEQLLQELETLTHTTRIQRMVELGHHAAHDPQIALILAALKQGNFYERSLALYSCFGSHDGAYVLNALTDPSRLIRGTAIHLTPLACNETQLQQTLAVVPRDGRAALLQRLHDHGYDALIDNFLEQLVVANDLQLLKLLPYGSPALVRLHIERIQSLMNLADWRRLARHHPAITIELLQAKAESTSQFDLQLLAFVNGTLPLLAKKQPDLTLTLVETLTRSMPLSRLNLQALLLERPVQLVDLVLQSTNDLGELDFSSIAHKLDNKRLISLQETHPARFGYTEPQYWLARIPPERRVDLYTALALRWRDGLRYGRISADIVALLPRSLREQEGRRHLILPSLTWHPEERLVYAAFLPWDEARSMLDPFLHDPSENVRSMALKTLIQIARYERTRLPEVLAIVHAHLHEPDPVYRVILDSLGELPRGIWRTEHLEQVEQIVQGTIDMFDASSLTLSTLLELITRLLERAPEWSATQFARVLQARGIVRAYGCLDRQISDTDVRRLGPALQPLLTSWAEKGDEKTFQHLLSMFGERIRAFEELLDALELVFNKTLSFNFGNQVLSTLVEYRPARAAQLIPELIQKDRRWINYPAIFNYLSSQRQDLLTPFLKRQKYSDLFNFSNAETGYRRRGRGSRPLNRGFARWTARQQTSFARTLLKVIHNSTNDHPTISRAITRLAALPAVPTQHLLTLASDQRPVIRDTALVLLNKLDDATSVLPTLLEALHDNERAVRATYALRSQLLAAPQPQALDILRSIPLTRVTIAKERVRLLGELPGEEAFQELLALDGQELHRDVRVALMRALGHHAGRDEAWSILVREAGSTDKIIALSTARLSLSPSRAKESYARKRFQRAERKSHTLYQFFWFSEWNLATMTHLAGEHLELKAQQRLMHLYTLLLARPEPDIQAAILRGCIRLPAADEGQQLLTRLLATMDGNDDEIRLSAASTIFGTSIASDATTIKQAVLQLLPDRRALLSIELALEQAIAANRQRLLPVVRAIIEALAVDPLTIKLRIGLAKLSLPWDEVAALLIDAAARDTLHADALLVACSLQELFNGRWGRIGRSDRKELIRLEELLTTSHDERLRRIALAAFVAQVEENNDWNKERRARLETYCSDPSALVAAAAQFTPLPGPEEA